MCCTPTVWRKVLPPWNFWQLPAQERSQNQLWWQLQWMVSCTKHTTASLRPCPQGGVSNLIPVRWWCCFFFNLETQVIPQHARQVGNCFYFAGRWRGTNEITAGTSERCLGGTNNSDVETGSFKDGLQRTPSWKLEPTVLPLSGSLFGFETACSKQECVLRVHIAMATVLEVSA